MKPINNHLKIQPVEQDGFIASSKGAYEEIGIVLEVAEGVPIEPGMLVYFDSWLAKKYPVRGIPGEYQWFVKYEDIVAIAYESVSEQPVST